MEEADVSDVMLYLIEHCNINQTNFDYVMQKVKKRDDILTLMIQKMRQNKSPLPLRLRTAHLGGLDPSQEHLLDHILAGEEGPTQHFLRVAPATLRLFINTMEEKRPGPSTKVECIIFLYWLANGFNYKEIEANFKIPRRSLYKATRNMLNHHTELLETFISHPPASDEVDQMGAKFEKLMGLKVFSYCIGVLSSLKVQCFKITQYEMRVQIVVDDKGDVMDLYVGSSDSDLFENCPLFTTHPPSSSRLHFILANKEYPCTTNTPIPILSPYKNPTATDQVLFNEYSEKAQKIGEEVLDSIVARWPLLFSQDKIHHDPERLSQVLSITVAIHMMCKKVKDLQYMKAKRRRPDLGEKSLDHDQPNGLKLRNQIADSLYDEIEQM